MSCTIKIIVGVGFFWPVGSVLLDIRGLHGTSEQVPIKKKAKTKTNKIPGQ